MRTAIPDISPQSCSIMIVSERSAFSQCMTEILQSDSNNVLTSQDESFKAMNGHAADLAFDHDVVIFEADPDDENELSAVKALLSNRSSETVFLALTNNDVSIAKARQFRDIGVDDVLPMSITADRLKATIDDQLESRRAPQQRTHDHQAALGKVIAVTQARGGIGATTVAVNLACGLVGKSTIFRKTRKSRVALLDFDLQFGNINVFLDLEDNGGFLQLVEAMEDPDGRFIDSVLQKHPLGVHVLCAPSTIAPLHSVQTEKIRVMLEILQQTYDYIIVDLPRALVDWVEPVLAKASQLVIVSDTSVPCVRQARRLIDFYGEDNFGLSVELVINREKRPLIKSEHVREAEKVLKTKLMHWLPDNARAARNSADLGKPIIDNAPRSDIAKALKKVTAQIATKSQPTPTKRA